MPRFSIVTALYNHRAFLEERVASVLQQTERDWEWIVVDDHSSDGSYEEICRLTESDARIRVLRNDRNLGFTLSTERALELADGEYFYRADSDDSCHPMFLRSLGTVLYRSKAASFVASRALKMDASGRVWGGLPPKSPRTYSGPDALRKLVTGNFLCAPSLLFRRSAVDAAGGFATLPELRVNSDWNLAMRCLFFGGLEYRDLKLSYYRQHAGNISRIDGSALDVARMEIEMFRPLDAVYELAESYGYQTLPPREEAEASACTTIARACVARGLVSAEDWERVGIAGLFAKHAPGRLPMILAHAKRKSYLRDAAERAIKLLTLTTVEKHRKRPVDVISI